MGHPRIASDRTVSRVCEMCGETFIRFKSEVLNPKHGRFCNGVCMKKWLGEFRARPLEVRFWEKVKKTDTCWLWQGFLLHGTWYGHIALSGKNGKNGKTISAHKLSWILHYGPIPDGLFVLHHCDTPPCVRPDHLFLGTQSDNMRDAAAKGRHPSQVNPSTQRGENSACAKLTAAMVLEMRLLRAETGLAYRRIGERYGVTKSCAMVAIKGVRAWTDLH